MDQRLILAVAGSGKTRYLIDRLNLEKRFLIVTYTINNYKNIKSRVLKKFGYIPENISIRTYFSFLLNFCYKPFFHYEWQERGGTWKDTPKFPRYTQDDWKHYMGNNRFLYHNRLAKLCLKQKQLVKDRLCRYYDCFYFDEVQDLAGYDFDFVQSIVPQNKDVLFVGDFFQHTFDTSVDGNLHTSLYDDFKKYHKTWDNVTIDVTTLSKSYRCTKQVCDFVQNAIGIAIESLSPEESQVIVIDDAESANAILLNDQIVKLVFKENYKYAFNAINWGASKGMDDFEDICVVLYKTAHKHFQNHTLAQLPPSSRNKLYVACTRAHRHLYIMSDEYAKAYKTK